MVVQQPNPVRLWAIKMPPSMVFTPILGVVVSVCPFPTIETNQGKVTSQISSSPGKTRGQKRFLAVKMSMYPIRIG